MLHWKDRVHFHSHRWRTLCGIFEAHQAQRCLENDFCQAGQMRLEGSHSALAAQARQREPDIKIRGESGAHRSVDRLTPTQSEISCSVCCSAQPVSPSACKLNSFDKPENEVFGVTDKEIEDIFGGSETENEPLETNEAVARREHKSPYSIRNSDGRMWRHDELVNDGG